MTHSPRLAFLVETVALEVQRLLDTDRMVHEYVRDAAELAEALNQGHLLVPLLVSPAHANSADFRRRGLLPK